MRVALADDDADFRGLLATFLQREGYEVVEAEDGQQLVRVVRTAHPDAVVTDVNMPRMGGLEALRAIRDRVVRLPIVLMTSLPDETVKKAVEGAKLVALLVKPFAPHRLVEMLTALLARCERPSWAA